MGGRGKISLRCLQLEFERENTNHGDSRDIETIKSQKLIKKQNLKLTTHIMPYIMRLRRTVMDLRTQLINSMDCVNKL